MFDVPGSIVFSFFTNNLADANQMARSSVALGVKWQRAGQRSWTSRLASSDRPGTPAGTRMPGHDGQRFWRRGYDSVRHKNFGAPYRAVWTAVSKSVHSRSTLSRIRTRVNLLESFFLLSFREILSLVKRKWDGVGKLATQSPDTLERRNGREGAAVQEISLVSCQVAFVGGKT